MSDAAPSSGKDLIARAEPSVAWQAFLESHPPDKPRPVTGLGEFVGVGMSVATELQIFRPDLDLHCDSEKCGGDIRSFASAQEHERIRLDTWSHFFLHYRCRNCRKTTKVYAVRCCQPASEKAPATAIKLGEWPPLGPVIPRKLLKLIEPDRELFEQGSRAEGQGMGIGAFSYYRRVVENQRTRLFDKLIEAATRIAAPEETIAALRSDRDTWQFSQSVAGLKGALPDSLKVGNQNPLALLHDALSHNLHNESDETCLDAAQVIRLVLTHLAEKLEEALRDRVELESAIGRLARKRQKTEPSSPSK